MMNTAIYMVGESYLAYKEKTMKSINIKDSQNVYDFVKSIWYPDLQVIERFLLLTLNSKLNIINYHWISQGGIAGTVIDTRVIFKSAIEALASGIVVIHNHPSGKTQPSEADIKITSKINKSADILEINLLDHLIITSKGYLSMKDEGLIS